MAEQRSENHVKYFIYGRPIPLFPTEIPEPEKDYELSAEELFDRYVNAGESGQPKIRQVHCIILKEKDNVEVIDYAKKNFDNLHAIWFGAYSIENFHDNLIWMPEKQNKIFTVYGVQYGKPDFPVELETPVYFSEIVSCSSNQEAIEYLCSKYDRIINIWEGQFNPRVDTQKPIYVEETQEENSGAE